MGKTKHPNHQMIAPLMRRILPERFRPIGYLTHLVRKRTQDTVRRGPFAGMRYIDRSIGSAHLPKLLGTYERELVEIIELVCAGFPELIIDLGAAEGYYAIGLALRNPRARVVAFENERPGREALQKMTFLNGVHHRVQIRGHCEPIDLKAILESGKDELPRVLDQPPFVICDVEGDEDRLLDPAVVPGLRTTRILVETHEFIQPGITDELRRRFVPTHSIESIWQAPRSRADFPFSSPATWLLPKSYLDWAVSEWRPVRMCWLWMKPR